MVQTREPRRRPPTRLAQAAKPTRSHYLIAGLAVGGLWLLNHDKSLLYHAVQMTALMSVLTVLQVVLQIVLRRRGAAPASPSAYARLLGLLLGAKLVLVAVGVGVEWLLAPWTARSNAIVAAGLVVLVTALGPVVDRRATNHAIPATGPDQACLAAHPTAPASAQRPAPSATLRQDHRSPNGRTHDRGDARWTP